MSTSSLSPFPPVAEGVPLLGVPAPALTTEDEQAVTVTFVSQEAAFKNALGFFALDDAGNLVDGEIMIPSSLDPDLTPGESTFVDFFPGGTQLGLFLIESGGDLIEGLPGEFLGGDVRFRNGGEAANAFDLTPPEVILRSVVEDAGGEISVIETAVDTSVFVTFDPTPEFPLTNELNDGGFTEAIAGISPDSDDAVRIGFEPGFPSAPRRRASPVEEGSTQGVVG